MAETMNSRTPPELVRDLTERVGLPDGTSVRQLNRHETELMVNELFVERIYFRHGIEICDEDTVVDVGANIGLFALHAEAAAERVAVYAFEPSPECFAVLEENVRERGSRVRALRYGIAQQAGVRKFTYYPQYAILSGFNANPEADAARILAGSGVEPGSRAAEIPLSLARSTLETRIEHMCEVKSLSELMEEHQLTHIDLLKINAGRSELDVLGGVREEHWAGIRQVVVEVHEPATLDAIEAALKGRGFAVAVDRGPSFESSGIANLYARRERKASALSIWGTFTTEPLRVGLEFWARQLGWKLSLQWGPYAQVFQALLAPESVLARQREGLSVLLLRGCDWLRDSGERASQEQLESLFDDFMRAFESYVTASPPQTLLVLCPEKEQPGIGLEVLARQRARLVTFGQSHTVLRVIDASAFHAAYRVDAIHDPRGDEIAHIPFVRGYYHLLSTLIARHLFGRQAQPYKVFAVDCDNTLWRGVCGEDGPDGVVIDDEHRRLQEFLLQKRASGFLLCLCSKNSEQDVWAVLERKVGQMPLRREHVTASRINWLDKAENLRSLATELNLGLDSFVFIDDNPTERAAVRAGCPQVLTPEWPMVTDNPAHLEHVWFLDRFSLTLEDRERASAYQAEAVRRGAAKSMTLAEFIRSLELEVEITEPAPADYARVAQLFSRTNQFNFTTIRHDEAQLRKLVELGHVLWAIKVRDRFGDYGLVGVMLFTREQRRLCVDSFLLSCRVLGRGVEHAVMARLGQVAGDLGCDEVELRYRRTTRNEPAWTFLQRLAADQPAHSEGDTIIHRLAAATLREMRFDADSDATDDDVETSSSPAPTVAADGVEIRMREDLLLKLCGELSTVAGLQRAIERGTNVPSQPVSAPSLPVTAGVPLATVIDRVRHVFAKVLRCDPHSLEPTESLDSYIEDSLKTVELTIELDGEFGEVPATLLFSHRTLRAIAEYLAGRSCELGVDAPAPAPVRDVPNPKPSRVPVDSVPTRSGDSIAIVAAHGRFPGANDIDELWRNLRTGRNSASEVPAKRWDVDRYFAKEPHPGRTYCRWGCFLDDVELFDAAFFRIAPREADTMDPQQRLFLEVAWELLERAGYTPSGLGARTGVFVGVIGSDYQQILNEDSLRGGDGYRNAEYFQVANRVSHAFDFRGPSLAVDTACSASGAALHLACQSLRARECDAAIVGGVNLLLHPGRFIQHAQMRTLSRDGSCRPFADGAQGILLGEGVCALLLKRLDAAEEARDSILGVIRGSAMNASGRTRGFTVPDPDAQASVIREAQRSASADPSTIEYVEAHGTGTALGDPVEIAGLTEAFGASGRATAAPASERCAIGSIKSNIGHLESAAAIAGAIKVLLQFRHGELVPSLNAQPPNPKIAFEATPFRVQAELGPWPRAAGAQPRRAGLSSFGAGGVNTHFVFEEYRAASLATEVGVASAPRARELIVLSSRSEESLRRYAARLRDHVERAAVSIRLADLAYTLQVGRVALEERLALVVESTAELVQKLKAFVAGEPVAGIQRDTTRRTSGVWSWLEGESETQRYLLELWRTGKLDAVARLWVSGMPVPFGELPPRDARRIELPTYPFEREARWLPMRSVSIAEHARGPEHDRDSAQVPPLAARDTERLRSLAVDDQAHSNAVAMQDNVTGGLGANDSSSTAGVRIQRSLFAEEWVDRPLESPRATLEPPVVVVLLSDGQRQAALLAALARLNVQAEVLFVEQEFAGVIPKEPGGTAALEASTDSGPRRRYAVQRDAMKSYAEVFSRIVDAHSRIDAIWCLWSLEDPSCITDQGPIVRTLQALGTTGVKHLRVLLAAEHSSALERCHIESWIGYERSIGRALPDVEVAVIHAEREVAGTRDLQSEVARTQRWTQRLWGELHAQKLESAYYAEERRHVMRVRPVEATSDAASPLRQRGTYLITGGLGGLGFQVAKHLAERYAARLILTGRSSLDTRKAAQLQVLEAFGAEAVYVPAHVADREQMATAIERGSQRFGTIDGIVHAAGIESSASLLGRDSGDIEAVLSPKMAGTLTLSELCKDRALDFICYFSSTSAVLGDFGACDYAVGNRFELACAKYVEKRAVAICWPEWADGTMRLRNEAAAQLYRKATGQLALPTSEGLGILEQLLASHASNGSSHTIVMFGGAVSVQRMLGLSTPAVDPPADRDLQFAKPHRADLRGLSQLESVTWELTELVSEQLNIPHERLDRDENLADFGFDSISLAEFAKRLSAHFAADILPSVFFSHATLAELAQYLVAEHASALQRRCSEPEVETTQRSPSLSTISVPPQCPRPSSSTPRSPLSDPQPPTTTRNYSDEPIAIVGMSGRFPGARTVEALWQTLVDGREAVQEIPIERFDWRPYYQEPNEEDAPSALPAAKTHSKWLGAIPGVEEFDPLFFEIAPKEAELMDPRQRLLLQESFNALENAGFGAQQLLQRKIGMFVGAEQGDYQTILTERGASADITANHDAILAARLSYFLNLHGPAMVINSACSSGLVAAHQACHSLRAGECDAAIAAAVHFILTPQSLVRMSQAGILSPDGRCYAFDRRANGTVPGEAVVALVLKRLSQAQIDGDLIHAVILGSGVNHDGKSNGITAPNGAAQTELVQEIYARAGVDPKNIRYVVTHGTGTRLGDPVEINALKDAFSYGLDTEPACAITSIKSNLGHTLAASGLVSLVSMVQALRHGVIPASLHCEQVSDYIDWKQSPFYVNTQSRAWPVQPGKPRLGAVSAFGISGTNAHAVVANYESPRLPNADFDAPYYLIALSAKTEAALQRRLQEVAVWLKCAQEGGEPLAMTAFSYTALNHRQHFNQRCAFIVENREQSISLLEKAAQHERLPALFRGSVTRELSEQPAFKRYASDLIARLPNQVSEPQLYRESLAALGELYCRGYNLNWQAMYGETKPGRVALPGYPFERDRHWVESPAIPPSPHLEDPNRNANGNGKMRELHVGVSGSSNGRDDLIAVRRGESKTEPLSTTANVPFDRSALDMTEVENAKSILRGRSYSELVALYGSLKE